jgi:uncharacterized membrane protein
MTLLLAFAIGVLGGLRSMTAPAVTCWGAHLGWLRLQGSPLAFMGATVTTALFTLFAVGELIADKLPSMPSRLAAVGLSARIVLGGLSGAAIAASGDQSMLVGAVLGGIGGVVGAFAGYHARATLNRQMGLPDIALAFIEDAIAIAGAFFIVSRG